MPDVVFPLAGLAEPFSALSHLLAAPVALLLAVSVLLRRRGARGERAALAVFGLTAVVLLTFSGLYHAAPEGSSARHLFQRLDHAAVWLLIAGCFTPIQVFLVRGWFGRLLLVLAWASALTGLALQSLFFSEIPAWLGVMLYFALGSIGTPFAVWLVCAKGLRFTLPFFLCGVSLTLGAIAQLAEPPQVVAGVIGYHELAHVAILAGLVCHCWFLGRLIQTKAHPRAPSRPLVEARPTVGASRGVFH